MKIHIVQKGDTLWKIAKKYGVNFEELKKMNSQLSNPDMIMPGMKVKVPTSGGMIKKGSNPGTAINLGAKKEMPIAEQPFVKEKPVPLPIKEAPTKEMPIKEAPVKEAPVKEVPNVLPNVPPNVPYTPKMPLPVVPEIDINNYYMMNMSNMTVQPNLPPKPANILPEVKAPVKEAPVKEAPVKEAPVKEAPNVLPNIAPNVVPNVVPPVEAPVMEQPCVPITPVMPGPGFCPPLEYFPGPYMPYPHVQGAAYPAYNVPAEPGYGPTAQGVMPSAPTVGPMVGAPGYFPHHFDDESSSFMPHMPMMNPGYPGAVPMGYPGAAPAGYPAGYPSAAPSGYPAGYPGAAPAGYPAGYPGAAPAGYPAGYPGTAPAGYPAGYPGAAPTGYPAGYPGAAPTGYPAGYPGAAPTGYPAGYPGAAPTSYPTGYPGAAPAGYPGTAPGAYPAGPGASAVPGTGYSPPGAAPYGQIPYGYPQMEGLAVFGEETAPAAPGFGVQGLPVGTGAMDCGCGAPAVGAVPSEFVPPTPPIYSAPYTGVNVAQPPFMNPYGIGPGTSPYGMPRYVDESNEQNG